MLTVEPAQGTLFELFSRIHPGIIQMIELMLGQSKNGNRATKTINGAPDLENTELDSSSEAAASPCGD